MFRTLPLLAIAIFPASMALAQGLGDPGCGELILVSSFFQDNVKIYDGCSGEFVRDLDDEERLDGPQAIVAGPQGDLFVVSENNARVVRYDGSTLDYVEVVSGDRPETPITEISPVGQPTGAAFSAAGLLYLGSFSEDRVVEISLEPGVGVREVVPANTPGLSGPDAGMAFGPDGQLYIPGFNSNLVVRANVATGATSTLPAGGNLAAPRTIVFRDGAMLVSSYGSNRVLEYDATSGAFVRTLIADINGPTGMAFNAAGQLLVTSDQTNEVIVFDPASGAQIGVLVPSGSGSLFGATFVYVFDKGVAPLVDVRQFWLIGVGTIQGNEIVIDEMVFTRNGGFGAALEPSAIEREIFGQVVLSFSACAAGDMSYLAVGENAARFGSGGYPLQKLASNLAGQACQEQGFDQVPDNAWMNGYWYGGASRDGEGFGVDVLEGNQAIATWYTYLPQ